MILCIGPTPAAQRVMVFGSLRLDAVNRAANTLDGAAGKSVNVAKVLAALGAKALATGFVGGVRGHELVRELASHRVETEFIEVSAATRQCVSVLDQTAHTVTELVEESRPVSDSDYESLLKLVVGRLTNSEAAVMSGSLTPGGPVDFYRRVTERVNQAGKLSIVDAQGAPLLEALKAGPGLVKPNRSELAATVQHALETEADVLAAMRELRERGASRVVVTAGTAPTLALSEHGAWRIESPRIEAVNPIGSGDAFTAGLVWSLIRKDDLGEACRWGAAAGAANALSAMPGDLQLQQVHELLEKVSVEKL